LILPAFFAFSFTLTVLVEPAETAPTNWLKLTPRPLTLSLTSVAAASPEFEILIL